jgi:hypothetical protein
MNSAFLKRSATVAAQSHVHAEVPEVSGGTAIYTLADPRAVRTPRYVGQTRNPHARFAQHVRTARLALPDAIPWWVRAPKHRPLYAWIRELHADGGRLPIMWVQQWLEPDTDALVAERAAIMRWLAQGADLLNVEARARQLPLL